MKTICTAAAIGLAAVALLAAQQQSQARAGEGGIEVLQLRPNFYMLVGAGGNIAVQVGVDGAVVVDAGSAARAPAVIGTIKQLSPGPIRYVINTNADADHVGGNETVARAGQSLFTAPDPTGAGPAGAAIMSAHRRRSPKAAVGRRHRRLACWPE